MKTIVYATMNKSNRVYRKAQMSDKNTLQIFEMGGGEEKAAI